MKFKKVIMKRIVSILLVLSMIQIPFTSEQVNGTNSNVGTTTEITYESPSEIKAKSVSGGAIDIAQTVTGPAIYVDFDVTFNITSQWDDAFNADITIENTANKIIDNWAIGFTFPYEITNIWNGVITNYDENGIYIIKNTGYNQDIPVGETVNLGFTASCSGKAFIPDSFLLLIK